MPAAETALILHRKGFDCGLEAKNLGFNCTTSQGKVSRPQVWEERGGRKQSPWGSRQSWGRSLGVGLAPRAGRWTGSLWGLTERKGEAVDMCFQSF